MKLLLKIRAKETGVAARLIARSDDLEALAAGVRKNLNILSGWRFEQFGKDALDLVEGRLAFAIENGKLKMSRVVSREGGDRRCVSWRCSPCPDRRLLDVPAAPPSTAKPRVIMPGATAPTVHRSARHQRDRRGDYARDACRSRCAGLRRAP